MKIFNVRVYGLLINDNQQILLSDEQEYGQRFTKFPGGGLEYGEGLIDGLKREFLEECNLPIEITDHFYTTDFFVKSAFNDSQIVSVYYKVRPLAPIGFVTKEQPFDFDGTQEPLQAFRWKKLTDLQPQDVTFPIDQYVIDLIRKEI
ncbi:NUDIX domain-containing protein [Mucilaginibacter sp. Bleaf8]|uniref:NUDIX domain-containing protein n=1 Tax=Mucilaginibacter sp. Bleaf8 TaxID=2834430 RepID=UPI001BCFE22C|nr:NUDIX domain-containing protein [Mucilaginibacter sp. Bleaf8]MBS7563068.1 NUDIX domain-containing protein [Mucilaginibacter sp. Bleaf8]